MLIISFFSGQQLLFPSTDPSSANTRNKNLPFKWHELLLVMTLGIKSFEPGPGIDSMAIATARVPAKAEFTAS